MQPQSVPHCKVLPLLLISAYSKRAYMDVSTGARKPARFRRLCQSPVESSYAAGSMGSKIFTPGPVYVRPEILAEMGRHPIGHRGDEMHMLLAGILPGLREAFGSAKGGAVFTAACSGTGLMETAIANAVPRKGRVLNLIVGTFGERWHAITRAAGREGHPLRVDWGRPVTPEAVEEALRSQRYDAVTLTHNETATGVLNPLADTASVVKRFEGVLLLVDAVSSLGGVPVEVDRNAIDFALSASQKCLALPAGLAVAFASGRCIDRARSNPDRGFYFDLLRFASTSEDLEPAFTPPTSNLFALRRQLEDIARETLSSRYERHRAMMKTVHAWAGGGAAQRAGFSILADPAHRSPTVTVVRAPEAFKLGPFLSSLQRRGYVVGGGVGQVARTSFRIGHMGDLSVEDVQGLAGALTDCLGEMEN